MLIEKEIISPGQYWYTDESTGMPRKLDVTPELCRYWHDQGSKMLSAGLTVPVPYEHDFNAHPMTPKDKLLNNAGWVKEYRVKDFVDPTRGKVKDALFGVVDVLDEEVAKKLPTTIRWSSPWINSFTDGAGRKWNNVISHLALTTRPRITQQRPFGSVAAALSLATGVSVTGAEPNGRGLDLRGLGQAKEGFCLSKAALLGVRKRDRKLKPRYPVAFSLYTGVALAEDDLPPPKKKPKPGDQPGGDGAGDDGGDNEPPAEPFEGEEAAPAPTPDDGNPANDATIDLEPFNDPAGDVRMEELLCDLLSALGIHCEKTGNEEMFKRSLYNAAMVKIHELTGKAQADQEKDKQNPTQPPGGAPNPLVQQEQQPMYMSLEEINAIPDQNMRTIALSMYNENVRIRAEAEANAKIVKSLQEGRLKEAGVQRATRIALLSKISPGVKADLEAMVALPGMALSLGDGGAVVDPMAQTLAVLEKGLSAIPKLLTTDVTALSVQPHPTDGGELSEEEINRLADDMARRMGCPPEKRAS